MAEQEPKERTPPGQQREPMPTSQAGATEELADEQLDQVAGGAYMKFDIPGESQDKDHRS